MHCEQCVPMVAVRAGHIPLWRLVCAKCGKATNWHIRPELDPVDSVKKIMLDYEQKGEQPPFTRATMDELRGYFADL